MYSVDEIIELWQKDSVIDRTEPGRELINIPILHAKYLKILSNHRLAMKNCEFNLNKLKKLKWEYYTGKMDKDTLNTYGWQPFPYTLKSEITTYLESDDELIKLYAKKQLHEEAVELCSSIIKELNSRTYQLRSFIDYEKFINGI
jgi:hypothetical protein